MKEQNYSVKSIYEVISIGSRFEYEELNVKRCFEKDPRDRIVSRFGNFDQSLLVTGIPTIVIQNIVPISDETVGEGCVTLFEAARRCIRRSPFEARYAEAGLDDNVLTFRYLMALFKALNINYIAAAIVFGIALPEARNISKLELDKYTAAIFSMHYKINFTIRGAIEDECLHEAEVNDSIKILGLKKSEKCKEQLKRKLWKTLFNSKEKDDNRFKVIPVTDGEMKGLAELISAFGISPSYGAWLLLVNKKESKKYYENMLRRVWQPENKRAHLMYMNARRDVVKLCENLLKNSIKFQCTVEEFVIAFLAASEIVVRLCSVPENSIGKTKGWLASEMYKCFRKKENGDA